MNDKCIFNILREIDRSINKEEEQFLNQQFNELSVFEQFI